MPDVSTEVRGDEFVRGVHGEAEGEELAEGFEAIKTDVSA